MRDSRRGKSVIDDLTTDIEGMTLYRGMPLGMMEHYVDQLPHMVHERQLDAMYEDVNAGVVLNRLLFQESVSLTLLLIEPGVFLTHIIFPISKPNSFRD